jgi:hypothetical protein
MIELSIIDSKLLQELDCGEERTFRRPVHLPSPRKRWLCSHTQSIMAVHLSDLVCDDGAPAACNLYLSILPPRVRSLL